MNDQIFLDIAAKTIFTAIKIAAPALLATLFMGVIISVIQAATQINEQTMSFIPKIIAMTVAMLFFGPWILQVIITFTTTLFDSIPNMIR